MNRTRPLVHSQPRLAACLALAFAIGCNVYDPDLLEERSQRRGISRQERDAAPSEPDASGDDAPGEDASAADGCGDGRVGEGEVCDIGIPRGRPGACPDGCSGGEACMRRELEGEGCQARCVERELTERVPGDGCCPQGVDHHQDDDCPARCGNGQVEPGERCDPPETCPSQDACKPVAACQRARFEGAADSCDARCELSAISNCVPDDGCCPPGCDAAQDGDCAPACPEGGCPEPPAPMRPLFECSDRHTGSACRACDCERCGPEVAACLDDPDADDAIACAAAIECGERERCSGTACFCGAADAEACRTAPAGACIGAWEDAARTVSPALILTLASSTSFTVGKAVRLLECRARSCSEECGL